MISNSASFTPEERAASEIEMALQSPRDRWAELEKAIADAAEKIDTETQAENYTTVIAQLQALLKRIDDAHDDVKEPYLNAGRKVDSATAALKGKVDDARRRLQATLTDYQVRRQRKIEAERAATRQAEEADPEPTWIDRRQHDRARTRVRSVEGASAHLATKIDCEIEDVSKIPLRYFQRTKVLEALKREILPEIRRGETVEGVKRIDGLESRVKV